MDLAAVRDVPDHQECWHNTDNDALFVLECLDYHDEGNDGDAMRYYWQDLCEVNGSKPEDNDKLFSSMENSVVTRGLPESATVCTYVGYQSVKMGRESTDERPQEERNVRVELCLIRLPSVQTDMLFTLSTPSDSNEQECEHPSNTFRTILSSLEIRDWGLFG